MNIKDIKISLLPILFLLAIGSVNAQGTSNVELEKIIVWVDNEIILKSELENTYKQFLAQGRGVENKEIECKVLETLIINKLMIAKSKIDSVYVEESMVDQELERRMEQMFVQYGGDPEEILKQYGKTMDQLKTELWPTLRDQMLIQKMQQKITGGVNVTPKEVKKFYKNIPKDSLPKFSTEVELGHIVRYPKPSNQELAATKQKLEDIKKRIEEGEDFGELAKLYSQDPGSAALGGELGFFKRGELVPEFEAAALKMRPGELSKVVKSQFGFHLIQLIERRGNEFNSKHILLKPTTNYFDTQREEALLDSLRSLITKDSIGFTGAAFKFNEDATTKQTNGFLTDYNGNNKIPVENLGSLYFTVEDMVPGEISQPIPYSDESSSKTGVRVLYLKSKTLPHVANLKDDYQKMREATLSEKKGDTIENWFMTTKNQIYIKVDEQYNTCKILEE